VGTNKIKSFIRKLTIGESIFIPISFTWYLINLFGSFIVGLRLFREGSESYGGFENIESFFLAAIVFTLFPHLLCMEIGKHNEIISRNVMSIITVIAAFVFHSVLTKSILLSP
jgi:hypothetical protein